MSGDPDRLVEITAAAARIETYFARMHSLQRQVAREHRANLSVIEKYGAAIDRLIELLDNPVSAQALFERRGLDADGIRNRLMQCRIDLERAEKTARSSLDLPVDAGLNRVVQAVRDQIGYALESAFA